VTLFVSLVETSGRIATSSGRLAKVRELASFLKSLADSEIVVATHYLSGSTSQGRIGMGYTVLHAAATHSVAETPTLSIMDIDQILTAIAAMRGAGSFAGRADTLRELFTRATAPEQEFLLRLLAGELRQGALEGIMLDAIATAAELPVEAVRRAAMYSKNLGSVARAALLEGSEGLRDFQLEVFSPVSPMLAQPATGVTEALAAFHEAAFEWKMDGARIQVHKAGDEVRIYTRNLNDVSSAVPEIVDIVRGLAARVLILDGEAIALDPVGRPHPFQITMRRFGRRLNVSTVRAALPISAFFFDCLLVNGERLIERSTSERFDALANAVPTQYRIPRLVTSSAEPAAAFYEAALAAGHEGLVAKSLRASYEAGNRGAGWLKIKRIHTLDLVVLAAEWGHGRRTGKLSNLHLGALDADTGEYVMLGKTFKGLTDAVLDWQTTQFLSRETRREGQTVYVRPELVVEIAFSDLQASVRYPGGLALRLARVKRYRTDKQPDEADSMATVRKLSTLRR
jgi:DNA ligase 1